jgi:hypothetical protein
LTARCFWFIPFLADCGSVPRVQRRGIERRDGQRPDYRAQAGQRGQRALQLALAFLLHLRGQHGLQCGHADAARSQQEHDGERHPSPRRKRQQDVAQGIGAHAQQQRTFFAQPRCDGPGGQSLYQRVQRAECGERDADRGGIPLVAVFAVNDPQGGRHLSHELHEEEDGHQCDDYGSAARPQERRGGHERL